MSKRVQVPPELALSTLNTILPLNPDLTEETTGLVILVAVDGRSPEMVSNMPPELLYGLLNWILQHADVAQMKKHKIGRHN